MKLSLDELGQLFQLVLQYLRDEKIQKVTFRGKDAYYPKIWRKDFKFDDPEFMKCPDFSIGSLDDDIADVKYVLADKFGFCSLHMEKFGAILNAVGALLEEKINIQPDDGGKYPELLPSELKLLFKIVLDFIKNKDVIEIFFDGVADYYLKIPYKDVNFYDDNFFDCPPYVIGSLTEDIIALKKVLAGEVKMDGVYLQKLGAVLTAIGETI